MHKFTIFTVLVSIITVAIIFDVVMNGYSVPNDFVPEPETEREVVTAGNLKTLKVEEVNEQPATNNSEVYSVASMIIPTSELLKAIGIEKGEVRDAGNKQVFLQSIELDENISKNMNTVNLFDFEEYLGTIYSLGFSNVEDSEQVYSSLKVMAMEVQGSEVRETNTFGQKSFYVNQEGKTKTAFSVVKIGTNLYGFEYPHKSHQIFKNISQQFVTAQTRDASQSIN